MTFKIGTRIKKVRGEKGCENMGITGIVVAGPTTAGKTLYCGYDIYIRLDNRWRSLTGVNYPAGTVGMACSSYWEPIIPEGHKPADAEFTAILECEFA